jgi:hypothetical protein
LDAISTRTTLAINQGCTRSLRISHTSGRALLQPVPKTQVLCTPYHPPNRTGVTRTKARRIEPAACCRWGRGAGTIRMMQGAQASTACLCCTGCTPPYNRAAVSVTRSSCTDCSFSYERAAVISVVRSCATRMRAACWCWAGVRPALCQIRHPLCGVPHREGLVYTDTPPCTIPTVDTYGASHREGRAGVSKSASATPHPLCWRPACFSTAASDRVRTAQSPSVPAVCP